MSGRPAIRVTSDELWEGDPLWWPWPGWYQPAERTKTRSEESVPSWLDDEVADQ